MPEVVTEKKKEDGARLSESLFNGTISIVEYLTRFDGEETKQKTPDNQPAANTKEQAVNQK